MRSLPGVLALLLGLFSFVSDAHATSDGLIAHWRLDETSGTTAVDGKGGNNGTLTNGPTWTTGKIGGAVDFDGTDDFVSMDVGTEPVLVDSAGTISAWIRPDSSNIGQDSYWPIFREYYHDNHQNIGGIGFFLYQAGPTDPMTVGARFGNISNNWENFFSPSPPILGGQWYHVVVSWTSSTVTLFVNGAEVYSDARTVMMGSSTARDGFYDMDIGRDYDGYGGGLIDDVRIYDRALSAAEVLELYNTKYCAAPALPESVMFYNACCKTYQFCNGTDWVPIGAAPRCTSGSLVSDLVAHWKLDEGSGTTAMDSKGSNNGTLVNGPVWISGQIGGAVEFDGTNDQINIPHSASLDTSSAYTLAGWIRFDSVAEHFEVFYSKNDTGNGGATGWGSRLAIARTNAGGTVIGGKVRMVVAHNANEIYTGWDFPYQAWFHLAVAWDGSRIRFYVDGVQVQDIAFTFAPTVNTGTAHLGYGVWNWGARWLDGAMDDMRLWNRALSAAEVGQIYNGTDMCP